MKTPFLLTALRRGLLLLLLVAGVLHALPGRAQTPQFMTYQGYLTDQNGNALATNGPQAYDIVFRIWPTATGGSVPLFGELQTVTVANGYFSVLLGQGSAYVSGGTTADPRPPMSTVFTNASGATNRYVEMTVKGLNNGSDVVILPRLQLVSAPYAFMAANANALVSPSSGNTILSSSGTNVIFNMPVSGNLTDIGGSIYMDNSQELYAKNTSGNYDGVLWPRWSDNVTYLNYGSGGFSIRNNNSSPVMWMGSGGNVGIGTSSPSQALEVNGDIALDGSHLVFNSGNGVIDWTGDLYFRTLSTQGNINTLTDRMHITSGGFVGIGTTGPAASLQVVGGILARGGPPGGGGANNNGYAFSGGGGDDDSGMFSSADGLLQFFNNSSEVMRLQSGLVGIQTTTPGYNLDVNGSFHAASATISGGYVLLDQSLDATAGNVAIGFGGFSNVKFAIKTTETYGLDVEPGPSISGYFGGNVQIAGSISKGSGSFKIDHPLDPENKWLYHSFVESPDMMNVYNGNIVTDDKGDATVILPSYFQALNKDYRYQLTVIGQFAQVMVSSEISSNSTGINFSIKSDKPDVKVSWQVTGIRQDAFANAHRIIPEVPKAGDEVGKYIHPIENGQPESKRIQIAKPVAAK